ncbi:MAG: HlyD family efflux transporter periplasmic adaptor subunit [Nitrospira sp.]|nr:HlyD family efflux transporter periplasmic adaptor subunit [Nitrospira sp.]MDH5320136.1 HlyD family efflux transporter periplasmic adaptor subunit [Nitrospira sp.]
MIPSGGPGAKPQERKLPPLRKNLQFNRGTPTPEGVPTWTIVDPVRNRYFQIEWPVYQMIQRWSTGTMEKLHAVMGRETTCRTTLDDVEDLVKFLYTNNLTEQSASGKHTDYQTQALAGKQNWLMWLVHHYLFVKIPLVHPHHFLQSTLPFVAPLYTAAAGMAFGALGLVGLIHVVRQWDAFLSTFLYFFNWRGAILYSLSLGAVKVVHELGHAYTATRFGCRVPTMGLAFMVMMPVLYSDVSDSYRLTSKRKRLLIAAGGVIAELGLAAVALFAWGYLPEGTLRSIAFIVATTSLAMSLVVNLNPLMRFDGYYVLADGLGIPNLQDRSFAFGQWKLRAMLFGNQSSAPEPVSAGMRQTMVVYAWATWLYRLILFTGIALMVYHYFFKALGIILFLVEIVWFIALPIAREVSAWWQNRTIYAASPRTWVTTACVSLLLALGFVPLHVSISVPAVLQASSYATIFAPTAGRIQEVRIHDGQMVKAGEALLVLENPALDKEVQLAETKVAMWDYRLGRQAGYSEDRDQRQVIAESLRAGLAELAGLEAKRDTMALKAPIAGMVRDRADSLTVGRWIDQKVPIAYLVDESQAVIDSFVPVDELAYVEVGQAAQFIPLDLTRPSVKAHVTDIAEVDEREFMVPYLASVYGGDVPVRKDDKGRLKPEVSVYRVRLSLDEPLIQPDQVLVGHVQIEGQPSSMAKRAWDQVVATLVRESGF